MKTITGKTVKTVLLVALPLLICIGAYVLYNQPARDTPAEDFTRRADMNLSPQDSIRFSKIQASIDKEIDSLERYPSQQWVKTYYDNILSGSEQDTSLATKPGDDSAQDRRSNGVLEGPSAFFSRRYSLREGKPVTVNILWAPDSTLSPVKLELVTLTLTEVADGKAGFIVEDSSDVLLYSETQYAVNDKISIEDKNHNLHISVLQVQPGSARIELSSYLTDELVSKLKGWD